MDFELISPIISDEDNWCLVAVVSDEEIKNATFDFVLDKTSGPDGFPSFFFLSKVLDFSCIGQSVIRAVKAFSHSRRILTEINHTFLALIPKIENPEKTSHFRPISLCSTIYKIIAKILANRLKVVLRKIIHPLQDNILIAHEVFHSFRKKTCKDKWIAIKLDMKKDYDRLEWEFVYAMLSHLGFNPIWISWIWACLSSIHHSPFLSWLMVFQVIDSFLLEGFIRGTRFLHISLVYVLNYQHDNFIITVCLMAN